MNEAMIFLVRIFVSPCVCVYTYTAERRECTALQVTAMSVDGTRLFPSPPPPSLPPCKRAPSADVAPRPTTCSPPSNHSHMCIPCHRRNLRHHTIDITAPTCTPHSLYLHCAPNNPPPPAISASRFLRAAAALPPSCRSCAACCPLHVLDFEFHLLQKQLCLCR